MQAKMSVASLTRDRSLKQMPYKVVNPGDLADPVEEAAESSQPTFHHDTARKQYISASKYGTSTLAKEVLAEKPQKDAATSHLRIQAFQRAMIRNGGDFERLQYGRKHNGIDHKSILDVARSQGAVSDSISNIVSLKQGQEAPSFFINRRKADKFSSKLSTGANNRALGASEIPMR